MTWDELSGGHGTFLGLINTFVHIIMYSYYLLTALGPGVQKYLWWKKHITRMQMVSVALAPDGLVRAPPPTDIFKI